MGNHKFRLSDMIPNAWFYKLRDMGRTKSQYSTNTSSNHHPKKKKKHHQPPPPPPQISSSPSPLSSSPATTITMLPIPQPQPSKSTTKESHQRKSYYFTRDLTVTPKTSEVSPRKSSSKQRRKKNRASTTTNKQPSPRLVSATVSSGCSCRTTVESVWTKPDSTSEEYPDSPLDSTSSGDVESLLPEVDSDQDHCPMPDSFDGMVSWSTSCHCKAEEDIVIDVNEKKQSSDFLISTSPELPPIITRKPEMKKLKKKTKSNDSNQPTQTRKTSMESMSMKIVKKEETFGSYKEQKTMTSPVRRLSTSSAGVRLRTNSPRIASKKIQAHARKSVSGYSRRSLSESFAVVKSSVDPQRDFRESMVEMILENNLKGSKDLEDLLACYLQLNSDDYHEVIIRVFKQIWFDLADFNK